MADEPATSTEVSISSQLSEINGNAFEKLVKYGSLLESSSNPDDLIAIVDASKASLEAVLQVFRTSIEKISSPSSPISDLSKAIDAFFNPVSNIPPPPPPPSADIPPPPPPAAGGM